MKSKTKHTNKMNIKKKIEQIDAKSNKIKTAPEKKAPLKSELVSQLKALKGEFDILVNVNSKNVETIKILEDKVTMLQMSKSSLVGKSQASQTFFSDI